MQTLASEPLRDRVQAEGLVEQQAQMVLATLDGAFRHSVWPRRGRERGEPPDGLTLLVTRSALRDASRDSAFIDGVEDARSPFWLAVREPLVACERSA